MYKLDRTFKAIAKTVATHAAQLIANNVENDERQFLCPLFDRDLDQSIGNILITTSFNEHGVSVTVNAQLLSDLGRANHVSIDQFTATDLAYAIGFSCATAFWRGPYRNDR